MKWTVIYEQDPDTGDWGAHAPDLPVFVGGGTREEVERLVREGIAFHIEGQLRGGPTGLLWVAGAFGSVARGRPCDAIRITVRRCRPGNSNSSN